MTLIDVKKIRDDVKANLARWDGCIGPHQFTDITPDKPFFKRWRCSLCGGECEGTQKSAYERGLAHGTAGVAKALNERDEARDWVRRLTASERILTCVYCGHAHPPGSPEHGADVLTAHVRVCEKHPMRVAEARIAALEEALAKAGYALPEAP